MAPSIVRKIVRRIRGEKPGRERRHPFDAVPPSLEAKWILDVGANDGGVAIQALKSYPDCKVICFEPVEKTFQALKERLAPYKERVFLYHQALSDRNGSGEINVTNYYGANSIEPQSPFHKFFNPGIREEGKERITLARLDDAAETFPTRSVDILKIDVEGHELHVLKGGERFLRSCVDTIIIEIALMRDQSWEHQAVVDIFSLMRDMGFVLINVIDLNYADGSDLMLVQMDCVFRHRSKLTEPAGR